MSSSGDFLESGLMVIARDATGHIVTRLTCTRSHELINAMKSAYSVLRLKEQAARVEVHRKAAPTSEYPDKPLAAMTRDDLPMEQLR